MDKNSPRILVSFFVLILLVTDARSQQILGHRSEIGFGLGTFNYTGDLVRTYNLASSKPAATVFYRSNISNVISLRTGITAGKIGASDTRKPIDAFSTKRPHHLISFCLRLPQRLNIISLIGGIANEDWDLHHTCLPEPACLVFQE